MVRTAEQGEDTKRTNMGMPVVPGGAQDAIDDEAPDADQESYHQYCQHQRLRVDSERGISFKLMPGTYSLALCTPRVGCVNPAQV
jgi:hypothetical protein